jgi:DNA-binding CsgD family transcriptional regulator
VAVPEDVIEGIFGCTGGNPLATVELLRDLRPPQLRGHEPLPVVVAPDASLAMAFGGPLRALPETTRQAMSVAAAEPGGDLRTVGLALVTLGGDVEDLSPAEEAGVVGLVDGCVRFDHPLRRAAAYHVLDPPSRRAVHRALAAACDGPGDEHRRAAHLDLGTVGPDAAAADALEAVAVATERRGRAGVAGRWWERAAALSPGRDDFERRRARADRLRDLRGRPFDDLTAAEWRVARAVGAGRSYKEAAAELFLSVKTVDCHLQAIYRKLGIRSRTELTLLLAQTVGGEVDLEVG